MIEKLRELEKEFGNRSKLPGYFPPAYVVLTVWQALPKLLDVAEAAGEIAYCHHPIYKGVDTPVDCGCCSGCKIRKTLDALEETK